MSEIKPCPFCGSKTVKLETSIRDFDPIGKPWWWVECEKCKTEGPLIEEDDEENAIKAWNTRKAGE